MEREKGKDWYGFIRNITFSATLHNPVMLSPTLEYQKYPCHLPSVHLPSAASLGWVSLPGVPPGMLGGLFIDRNNLCPVPTARP